MVEPINLRQFRKRKARDEKDKIADDNRKKFGISTKLKKVAKANERLAKLKIDYSKLEKKD